MPQGTTHHDQVATLIAAARHTLEAIEFERAYVEDGIARLHWQAEELSNAPDALAELRPGGLMPDLQAVGDIIEKLSWIEDLDTNSALLELSDIEDELSEQEEGDEAGAEDPPPAV